MDKVPVGQKGVEVPGIGNKFRATSLPDDPARIPERVSADVMNSPRGTSNLPEYIRKGRGWHLQWTEGYIQAPPVSPPQ